jgi:hypothetical protein
VAERSNTFTEIWRGETVFDGYGGDDSLEFGAASDGVSASTLIRPVVATAPGTRRSGNIDVVGGNDYFDICEGTLHGWGQLRFGAGDAGIVIGGQVSSRTRTSEVGIRGAASVEVAGSDVSLADAEFTINADTLYTSGRASFALPGPLQQLAALAPGIGEGRSACLGCIDFTLDPIEAVFELLVRWAIPSTKSRLQTRGDDSTNEVRVAIDVRRNRYLARGQIEVGVNREITGDLGEHYELTGEIEFDGAGQVEFRPIAERPVSACVTDADCFFGQWCEGGGSAAGGQCTSDCLAGLRSPPVKDRFHVFLADAGAAGDVLGVSVEWTRTQCRDGTQNCALDDPARYNIGFANREIEVEQTGFLTDREMIRLLRDELRLQSQAQCPHVCELRSETCAREECGLYCIDSSSAGCQECLSFRGVDCSGTELACTETCDPGLPISVYSDTTTGAPRVIIEADALFDNLVVQITRNGQPGCNGTNCPVIGVDSAPRPWVNGQIGVKGQVLYKFPPLGGRSGTVLGLFELGVTGDAMVDMTEDDGDPIFIGVNGDLNLQPFGAFPAFNLAEATLEAGTNSEGNFDFAELRLNVGIGLGPGGSAGRLGNTGLTLGYDNRRHTLCSETDIFLPPGFSAEAQVVIDLPVNEAGEFDETKCGMHAGIRLVPDEVPFLDSLSRSMRQQISIDAEGGFSCDGSWSFAGNFNAAPEFIPGFRLQSSRDAPGEPMFRISNEGVRIAGDLSLPLELGRLTALGEVNTNGTFEFALSGGFSPGGFTMSEVTGSFTNAGVELSGTLALPGDLATVRGTGRITAGGDFSFIGTQSIIIGGTTLTDARIEVRKDGGVYKATIDAMLQMPGVSRIRVNGTLSSTGYMLLTGTGDVGLGSGMKIGPVTLTLERTTGGTTTLSGSGSMTVAGWKVSDVGFSVGTAGNFSGNGSINLWGLGSVELSIARPIGGIVDVTGGIRVSVSGLGHTISGELKVSFVGGTFGFSVSGGVSGPLVNFSASLSVDGNGCIKVSDLGRICLGE